MSSSGKKRSLNDQILEFLQPAPKEVDPEGDLVPAITPEVFDAEPNATDAAGSGRLLLRPEISLGTKYAGKKVSRKALADDIDESFSSNEPDAPSLDDAVEENEQQDDEDQSVSGSESDRLVESESSSAHLLRPKTLDEADKLQTELNQILAQESTPLVDITPSKKELTKAKHARNQRILYADFLEMRIRLQKSVTIANRLPHPVEHRLFSSKNPEVSSRFAAVSASIRELLGDLCEMQSELLQQNPSLSAGEDQKKPSNDNEATQDQLLAVSAVSRKRMKADIPTEKLWSSIAAIQQGIEKQADPVLDKWNAKVHLTAGLANKKFKALNTSIVAQLHQTLDTERERLITRTQQKRNQYRVLGSPSSAADIAKTEQPKGTKRPAAAPEFDDQIFDDTDFYQQLLKDLLDASIDEKDPTALTKKWLANKNATTKQHRPNVDRKASKGRKIKYVVHDKLVNFMTPVPLDRPVMADELFQKLFQS